MPQKSSSQTWSLLHRLHILLGLVVSLPLLSWSVSGLFLAIPPGTIKGEPYRGVESARILVQPDEAVQLVREHESSDKPFTAITLEQRGENPRYSIFTGSGSLYVDAVTGAISEPPPPTPYKRWIGQAHFFNFAGENRNTLLIGFALLTAMSTLSGLVLLLKFAIRRLRPSK